MRVCRAITSADAFLSSQAISMFKPTLREMAGSSLLLVSTLAGGAVWAQSSANGLVNATVRVLAPISIEKDKDINFGVVVSGPAGVLVLTPAGIAASSAALRMGQNAGFSVGRFKVNGESAHTYLVTLPSSFAVSDGKNSLELTGFKSYADESLGTDSTSNTFTLTAAGTGAFKVGATLTLPAAAIPGNYSGIYAVTVAYN
jgi:hypothetical protein